MKKISVCVILVSLFFGGAILAKVEIKGSLKASHCEEDFVLSDRYDHECAVKKYRWYSAEEAIQKCLFKVDVSNCAKSLVIDTAVNANCYEFAFRGMDDAQATELCTLNTYRCRF